MANKNRERDSYSSNENWNQNRNRREDDYNDYHESSGGYGNVGYGSGANKSMRGDYGRHMRNEEQYGNINDSGGAYSSDYGYNDDLENNFDNRRRWNNELESNYEKRNIQQRRQDSGNYNTNYDRNRDDWRRSNVNSASNYGERYGSGYNDQRDRRQESIYGGDTSNYGNANQGGYDRGWWDKTKDEVSSWFGDDDAERRRHMDKRYEGKHRGKGPKGYERSAERIREDVCERLSYDDQIDASDIEVKVEGHEVTLDGTVDNRNARHRAEDIIESIPGVTHIQNNLRVSKPGTYRDEY